ncbi:MAG: magnesium transporter [Erysipelotrichaceae bacterium]|nr:magnesium transporter [Erysipelotrichaceae bacterium]
MLEKIIDLISKKDFKRLKALLEDANNADISECLDELSEEDVAIIFRLLPKSEAADIFAYMEPETQEDLLNLLSDKEISDIISGLFVDDAADLIGEMPANVVTRLLKNTKPEKRKAINEILKYPDDSAGSIMTTDFIEIASGSTVKDVFDKLRKVGKRKEAIYILYIVDPGKYLAGVIDIKDLLLHDYDDVVDDFMEDNVISATTSTDQEEVARMFDHYDFLAMPVVDNENRLVGVITVDDAMEVLSEEHEEDLQIMSAIAPDDEGYSHMSVFKIYKNRIVWLLFLMLSATFTGIILNNYEEAFASIPILVSFIPMIMDTGGNCGAQASTSIICALATGDIETKDILKVWGKEITVAAMCGVSLAIVNTIRIMIMYPDNPSKLVLSLVVGLTIIATAILAKSLGVLLPIAAKKLKLDPAYMASPLITTTVDAVSLVIYFSIAVTILKI